MINHLKTLLICGAALCFNMSVYGQAVSIDLQNVTVKKAITELKEKTGYSVVFSTEDLDTKKVVNVKATDLKEAVSQIITGQNVTFEVQGKRIIIHRESSQDTNSGQQAPIKGVVRGNDGEPIVGATVIVKGTTIGTITDANGRFELNAAPNSTLVISYLGYQQAETSAKKGDLKITLEEDTELLDDVVVVGYGSVKKSNLTGAVASVKMDKVEKVATTDVSNILMGRVAGLDISQTSASPDGGYSMVIRGQASTGAGNTPLYVIDGFPGGDISTVNPSDIESVEVLKDASSTSIYGARAANGVILVTTKKGKEGKAIVNLKLSGSLQSIENPYDIVDAKEYMQLANSYYYEKWLYSNKIAPYGTVDPSTITSTPTYPFSDADIASAVNTDYWDQMTRTGVINEENLSISGGSEKMHYLLSLGHYNQKGVIENSGKQKFMARFNMDYTFNKYISTGVTASGTRALFDLLQESSNSDNLSIINSIIMFPNYLQPYDANGNYTLNPNHGGNNPLSLNEVTNRRKNTRLLISNYWNFQITPDLLARVSWGWNYGETRRDHDEDGKHEEGRQVIGKRADDRSRIAQLPDMIERLLHIVHQHQHGIEHENQTDTQEDTALGVYQIAVDKADDRLCRLRLRLECVAKPDLDVFVIAETPRNGEDHRDDGDKSQECGISQRRRLGHDTLSRKETDRQTKLVIDITQKAFRHNKTIKKALPL